MTSKTFFLQDEQATKRFGALLAERLEAPAVIHLSGDLGAGKTTLTRGFLQGLGYQGRVKSPTYTLVEPYQIQQRKIYHFDLYRIHDPEELELMGIRDYFAKDALIVLEWPEKAQANLPEPDLSCYIQQLPTGRQITLSSATGQGKKILAGLVWND